MTDNNNNNIYYDVELAYAMKEDISYQILIHTCKQHALKQMALCKSVCYDLHCSGWEWG